MFRVLAVVLPLLVLAGCATRREASVPEAEAGAVRLSAAEIDRRAELHARFAAGIVHDLRNEPRAAEEEFRAAVLADPANEPLALDLAQRLLQNREPLKAVEILQWSAQRPEASGLIYGWLGAAQSQATNGPAAVAAWKESIRRSPQSIIGYHGLATYLLQNQQTNEALSVLDGGAAQTNASPGFLVDLASFQVAATRQRLLPTEVTRPRTLELLDRAARLQPSDAAVRQRMAEGYKALGEARRAIALYEEFLKDQPAGNRAMRLALHEQLFQLYVSAGETAEARPHLEAILSVAPANPRALATLGALLAEQRQFAEAERNFEKAMLLDPDLEPVYYDLAGVQLALRKPDAAWETVERARSRFRVGFLTELYSGLVRAAQKRYVEAINHFGAAELHARVGDPARLNDFFYFQMGAANERAGRYDEAALAFEKCLELNPDNVEALNYLGYMWAERGERLDRARALIEKAIQIEPENAAYLDSLAWVLFKLGKPAEALPHQLRAVELSEEPDATLLDHLGDIQRALGRIAEARDAWTRSLALEPNPAIEGKLRETAPAAEGPSVAR